MAITIKMIVKIIIKNTVNNWKSQKFIGQNGWEHQLYIKNNYINITVRLNIMKQSKEHYFKF